MRDPRGRFVRGQSGNPNGRPRASLLDRTTQNAVLLHAADAVAGVVGREGQGAGLAFLPDRELAALAGGRADRSADGAYWALLAG